MSASQEVPVDALPPQTVKALTELYGGGPPGRFLRGKHGITHFHLEGAQPGQRGRIAVLSHGIGTSMAVYDGPIRDGLLAAGFRVLRYDFLANGWSVAAQSWLRYDKDMMLTQLKELLDHVLEPEEPVDLWVGHSTGGLVGPLAAMAKVRRINEYALISPAFWANKPLIARVADKIPEFMHGLVKSAGFLKKLPQDAYLENNDKAFGVKDGKYLYPKNHKEAQENIKNMFTLHPQAVEGILGIATFFLREDLLVEWRAMLKQFMGELKGDAAPRVCLLWGKYDVVVPFEHAKEVVAMAGDSSRVSLVPLEMGHESPAEDSATIVKEILKFSQPPSRM